MEYMSAREAANKWDISQRRVAVLCSESRIDNATMVGNMWIIPTTATKPIDARSTNTCLFLGSKSEYEILHFETAECLEMTICGKIQAHGFPCVCIFICSLLCFV